MDQQRPSALRKGFPIFISLASALVAASATAHLQPLRGQLIDLIQRSDLVVIASVQSIAPLGTRKADVHVKIQSVILGKPPAASLSVRSFNDFGPDDRVVLLLHRTGKDWESVAPSGVVFACAQPDDSGYRATIQAVNAALHRPPAKRADAVRAALIPALTASAEALRYQAALELVALAHDGHGPTDRERRKLQELIGSARLDPALQPLISNLLH